MTMPCLRMYPVDWRGRLIMISVVVSTSMGMACAVGTVATCVAEGTSWEAASAMLVDDGSSGVLCPAPACAGGRDDAATGAALGWPQAASRKKLIQSMVMPSVNHCDAAERGGGKAIVTVGRQEPLCHLVIPGAIRQRIMAS